MMKAMKCIYLMLCLALVFSACAPEPTPEDKINEGVEKLTEGIGEAAKGAAKDLEGGIAGALSQLENAVEGIQKDGIVKKKPVNFRKLKELLPTTTSGFERSSVNGESTGMAGFNVSTVKARYKKEDKSINIEMIDAGGLGSAMMGLAAWSMLQIDKESDNGFERTTTYKDYKAFEKCNRSNCEFSIFVADRFLLNVNGNNVNIDDLHDIVDDIGLQKLEALKDEEG